MRRTGRPPLSALRALRVPHDEFRSLPLRSHALLSGVPILDVSSVDLPGGGPGRRIADVRALGLGAGSSGTARILFGVRRLLGRTFGWDRVALRPGASLAARLTEEDRRESEVAPGTRVGSFLLVYQFPTEILLETRNATVHGWVAGALVPIPGGYRYYAAVYVRRVSALTRPYLAVIAPFRRVLYPALLRGIQAAWLAAYPRRGNERDGA